MLDPDLVAEFEAWKAEKLNGQLDLSIATFNREAEALALAYEQGVKDAFKGATIRQNAQEVIDSNPYRGAGMKGERPGTKRITS